MNLILLGPPGAGKGTQAKRIYADFKVPQISTGDILREAVRNDSELGRRAKPIMEASKLVPDELIVGIVEERLKASDCTGGFVLDGFPGTIPQAEALERMLAKSGREIDAVISLEVPIATLIERQTGRRSCPRCETIYHITLSPPRSAGLCDKDGASLVQREDDKLDVARGRQSEYVQKTAPLKAYYQSKGLLKEVDGVGSTEVVYAQIKKLLGK